MIVITGACGFIGSVLIHKLNCCGYVDIIGVDKFENAEKLKNISSLKISKLVDRDNFFVWFEKHHSDIDFVFHIGARTDTTEINRTILDILNTQYSKQVWNLCTRFSKPLVYASSAATYGSGTFGFDDNEECIPQLRPLNAYGISKQKFDEWVLLQTQMPPFWAGLKFFNVYGPNEYHKGRMASVVYHAYHQMLLTHKIRLFKSYNPGYSNGEQKRDFIYVKDLIDVLMFLMKTQQHSGIYNVGTAQPATFLDLARSLFKVCNKLEEVEFIEMPLDIRRNYQYYTCASMSKLRSIGYTNEFHSLEDGISDYVTHYLCDSKRLAL